jgi:hypothetical protein
MTAARPSSIRSPTHGALLGCLQGEGGVLDGLLTEPLEDVQVRESDQRETPGAGWPAKTSRRLAR